MININDCFIRDKDTFIKIIELYDNNLCRYEYISFINNELYYDNGFSSLDYLKNKELKPISEEIWKQAESLYTKYIEDLKEYKDILKYTFNSILNDSSC